MPRRPRHAGAPVRQPARSPHPFDALASLRGKLGVHASAAEKAPADTRRQGKARPANTAAGSPSAQAEPLPQPGGGALAPEDRALFRASVTDIIPLPDRQRAEIETPKPPPVPRPRPAEPEPPEPPKPVSRPELLDDAALFRAAMEDVTPLEHEGRVEVGRAPRRAAPHRDEHGDASRAGSPAALWPADVDALSPDELFRYATLGTQAIDHGNRVELQRPSPEPQPLKRSADEHAALRESLEAPLTLEDRLEMGDEAAFLRPGLPRRVLADLRRGRWVLQGQLDLHGLNREEAREALARFLVASLKAGHRCVRVIHGKGLGSPGKESILKQLSRGWLAQRSEILAFCQAGPYEGGSGALMVLLAGRSPQRSASGD